MRISKEKASEIARQMTVKQKKIADEALREFQRVVTDAYKKQIPITVINTAKKFPGFISKTSAIRLEGHGFNWKYVSATEKVIKPAGTDAMLTMTSDLSKILQQLNNKADTEKEKYEVLCKEIVVALLSLKTFAGIQKHLPEAIPFLPKSESMALMPDLSVLRKKLVA